MQVKSPRFYVVPRLPPERLAKVQSWQKALKFGADLRAWGEALAYKWTDKVPHEPTIRGGCIHPEALEDGAELDTVWSVEDGYVHTVYYEEHWGPDKKWVKAELRRRLQQWRKDNPKADMVPKSLRSEIRRQVVEQAPIVLDRAPTKPVFLNYGETLLITEADLGSGLVEAPFFSRAEGDDLPEEAKGLEALFGPIPWGDGEEVFYFGHALNPVGKRTLLYALVLAGLAGDGKLEALGQSRGMEIRAISLTGSAGQRCIQLSSLNDGTVRATLVAALREGASLLSVTWYVLPDEDFPSGIEVVSDASEHIAQWKVPFGLLDVAHGLVNDLVLALLFSSPFSHTTRPEEGGRVLADALEQLSLAFEEEE